MAQRPRPWFGPLWRLLCGRCWEVVPPALKARAERLALALQRADLAALARTRAVGALEEQSQACIDAARSARAPRDAAA